MLGAAGERIATDGVVVTGRSSLDARDHWRVDPGQVELGDAVRPCNDSAGALEVETTAAGTDNSLTTIVEPVEQAQAEKGDRAASPTASAPPSSLACSSSPSWRR
ncbi:hypothetical protein QJS66_21320 [Kocuria rhizophila]|nr:hypothetical protein QJS66_21320 [Kocuria rhizophila]